MGTKIAVWSFVILFVTYDKNKKKHVDMRRQRRPQTKKCKRCGKPIKVAIKGRVPTYCGQSCKQQAYQRRRFRGPMLLLEQDIATMKVQAIIRREISDAFKQMGLISESQPLVEAPKRKSPTLRLVKTNQNDRSDDEEGSN
jgi:hypothetical protein